MYAHASAPCRVGIAGGGTDLPAWTRERRGFCLSLAIDAYAHAVVISRLDRQVVASYRRLEFAPFTTDVANGLIRESALLHGFEEGFEVHTIAQVPSAGSGLGVSSSIAVALAAAFWRASRLRQGQEAAPDEAMRDVYAKDAWTVEIKRLRQPIGRQDHMAAAHGGLRLYVFEGEHARVERTFSREDAEWVAGQVALLRLPEGHDAREILSGVKRVDQLQAAADAVDVAVRAVEGRDPELLGRALSGGQASKASIPGAVPPALVDLLGRVAPHAWGTKVAGAGGGGHVVFVPRGEGAVAEVEAATGLRAWRPRVAHAGVASEGWK